MADADFEGVIITKKNPVVTFFLSQEHDDKEQGINEFHDKIVDALFNVRG